MVIDAPRNALTITLSVWRALFLREAVFRLFGSRGAWFWLLLEPIAHIAILMAVFGLARLHNVGGVDTSAWLMIGLLTFFMFKRTALQSMHAVNSNQSLFSYRQVKAVDTVLMRAGLEGFLMILIAALVLGVAALVGLISDAADPLAVLEGMAGMWLMGLGLGLVTSVATELVPEVGQTVSLLVTPLYFLSGVMFPLSSVPPPYRDWLTANPLIHGIESARRGIAPHYQVPPDLDLGYLFVSALLLIAVGLALHLRFAQKLHAA